MCDYLKRVSNEEKTPEPEFTYDPEKANKSPPGSIYLGEANVKSLCPTIYPADSEDSETKERCERAIKKFWKGENGYCTVRQLIRMDYNQSSVSLFLESPGEEEEELEVFTTDKSWEEILEEVHKEFSWVHSPESGLTINMTGLDVPGEEIRRMKIEIKGVYPFCFPFLKYWPAPTEFLQQAISVKFYQHLYALIDTLKTRTKTPKKKEKLDDIIQGLKEAFQPFVEKVQPKLHVISNEEKGEIE